MALRQTKGSQTMQSARKKPPYTVESHPKQNTIYKQPSAFPVTAPPVLQRLCDQVVDRLHREAHHVELRNHRVEVADLAGRENRHQELPADLPTGRARVGDADQLGRELTPPSLPTRTYVDIS